MAYIFYKFAFNKTMFAAGLLLALVNINVANAGHIPIQTQAGSSDGANLIIPEMDPEKGKTLFVDKGCVACHAVNGVGGHDAPAMDAHGQMKGVNPFDFAARMWNHAPGMIAAQEDAFDEQISLTGDDLAHIIAFVHDDRAQHGFSEKDLTAKARKMMGHSHGGMEAPDAHADEAGHGHGPEKGHEHQPGTPAHKD